MRPSTSRCTHTASSKLCTQGTQLSTKLCPYPRSNCKQLLRPIFLQVDTPCPCSTRHTIRKQPNRGYLTVTHGSSSFESIAADPNKDTPTSFNKYHQQSDDNLLSAWDAPGCPKHHTSRRGLTNKVQLSTYADAIGNDLNDLTAFLQEHVKGEMTACLGCSSCNY